MGVAVLVLWMAVAHELAADSTVDHRCRRGGCRRDCNVDQAGRPIAGAFGDPRNPVSGTVGCAPPPLSHLQHRRALPGSDTDPSANGPDRHRHTADYRTGAAHPPGTFRKSDRWVSLARAQPSLTSIVHAVAGRLGSERSIKARPARRARSSNASASSCSAATIAGDARSAGIRCGGDAISAAM